MSKRICVKVRAMTDEEGKITPLSFTKDGQTLPISRVLERREARETRAGGQGIRYLVCAGNQPTYLYLGEDRRWYVEENDNVREISYLNGG